MVAEMRFRQSVKYLTYFFQNVATMAKIMVPDVIAADQIDM